MIKSCCSAHRCCSIDCASCAWRYSLSAARRILTCEPRSLHVATIACAASSPAEFRRWRKKIHNVFCYRRSRSRWWRSVGMWGWWDGTGLHGLVELGSTTQAEFMNAVRRHGGVRLRAIAIEDVRPEVYRAAQRFSPSQRGDAAGRYQPVKIAIEPVITAVRTNQISSQIEIEPLPAIF